MNSAILALAAELTAAGEPFAVATVVRREAPSSAQLGDTAIITRDGRLHGFIGGSCTRDTVVHHGLQALASGEARLISFRDEERSRADDIIGVPMTCHSGGSVEIYIDPVFPMPRLLLLGSSPVNRALARLGKAMGYSVHVGGGAAAGDFGGDVDEALESLDGLRDYADRDAGVKLFALVATMGESDEDMLAAALAARPDYLGVIVSRRRMEEVGGTLRARGVDDQVIAAIDGPAGLDLGGTRPEEIAISVLAKIIAQQRQLDAGEATETGAPLHTATGAVRKAGTAHDASAASSAATALETAIDPVCNMTVPTDGSKPQAEYDGVTYHFCCSGCRDRFLADPEPYVAKLHPEATTDEGAAS